MPASTSRCACTAARPWPASSPTRPGWTPPAGSRAATTWRRCRSDRRSWLRSPSPVLGAASSPRSWTPTRTRPGCGSSARTCRRRRTGSRSTPRPRTSGGCRWPNVHFDDHPNDVAMREHGYGRADLMYEAVGATGTHHTPPYPATHNLGTCRMSERPEDGVIGAFGQAHDVPGLFVSDGSVMTTRRRGQPDAHHRRAGDPAGRAHRRASSQGRAAERTSRRSERPR